MRSSTVHHLRRLVFERAQLNTTLSSGLCGMSIPVLANCYWISFVIPWIFVTHHLPINQVTEINTGEGMHQSSALQKQTLLSPAVCLISSPHKKLCATEIMGRFETVNVLWWKMLQKKPKTLASERQLLPGWQGCYRREDPQVWNGQIPKVSEAFPGNHSLPLRNPPAPRNPSPPCTRPSFANWNRSCWTASSFQISPHEASTTETFKMNISKRLLSFLLSDKNLCSQEGRFRIILRIASWCPCDSSGLFSWQAQLHSAAKPVEYQWFLPPPRPQRSVDPQNLVSWFACFFNSNIL